MTNAAEFLKLDLIEFEKCDKFAYIKKPELLRVYKQIKYGSEFHYYPSNLKYFKEPELALPLDLDSLPLGNYDLNSMLNVLHIYILASADCAIGDGRKDFTRIISDQKTLINIMMSPYTLKVVNWKIHAIKFNGVIYLKMINGFESDFEDKYNLQFKQFCFVDSPSGNANIDTVIDKKNQRYCVYRTELNNFDITYASEAPGAISDEIKDVSKMTELNDCRFIITKLLSQDEHQNLGFIKMLSCWLQCYLTNVTEVYLGNLGRNHYIDYPPTRLLTKDIPNFCEWKPNVCNAFLDKFLRNVRETMRFVDCPYTVHEFYYYSRSEEMTIYHKVHKGETEYSFLPKQISKKKK